MSLNNIAFLDIETIPISQYLVDDQMSELFKKRFSTQYALGQSSYNQLWDSNAALYAEFGKIVCVSIGKVSGTGSKFFIKTIMSRDEKTILEQLSEALTKQPSKTYCAHNGKEFDFPFLMRKYIMNQLPIPELLNTFSKKPWEVNLEDTMQMWSGTQWNYKISLDLLCYCLGVPSPKGIMTGGSIADIYYGAIEVDPETLPFDKEAAAMEKIGTYCAGDVLALAKCYAKMKNIPFPEVVEYV